MPYKSALPNCRGNYITGPKVTSFLFKKKKNYAKYGYVLLKGLVSLFNGISTLFRLFYAKAILLEEQ